jgi:AcrR family transcriptional regulator
MPKDASDRGRGGPRSREPQQARSRATHARILRAASELIEKQGYESTSMAEIAEQAEIGTGTLYHHFPDKRAILLELIDAWGDRIAQERRSDLDLETFFGADPRVALAGILRRVYQRLRNGNWLYAEIFRLLPHNEEVRRRYRHLEQAGAEYLAAVLEFGQRRGLLRSRPDPMTAAFLIINAIELVTGHVLVLRRSGSDVDRIIDEATDMLCRYLVENS